MHNRAKHKSPRVGVAFVPSRGPRLPLQVVPPVGVGARRQDKGVCTRRAFRPSGCDATRAPAPSTQHPHPCTPFPFPALLRSATRAPAPSKGGPRDGNTACGALPR